MKRKIIKIDEEKCNGCGLCVPACHEGAIQIINGKAKLVKESYCDGLGACLGDCPQGAITMEERETDAFDPAAMEAAKTVKPPAPLACGCPGTLAKAIERPKTEACGCGCECNEPDKMPSQLSQWPVQLHLVPANAAYWNNADLLISADCVSVACGSFQQLLKGKKVIIACPKLDDTGTYVDKLKEILIINSIRSLTVAFMEVPCCTGIVRIVEQALAACGKDIPLHKVKVGIDGSVQK